MAYDYDLIVIGGGPGGYTAAIRSAQLGAKTALVEKTALGGTCLNKGCIPTKSLIDSVNRLKAPSLMGINLTPDLAAIMERKNKAVTQLVKGVGYLMEKNQICVIPKKAAFLDPHTLDLDGKTVTGEKFIIASGSLPQIPEGLQGKEHLLISDQILELDVLPESLAIIGGGVIGVELAGIFASLGSKVTIIEYANSILPDLDGELTNTLARALKQQKIQLLTEASVSRVEKSENACKITYAQRGNPKELPASLVLCATGRQAYFQDLGLDKAGVKTHKDGITTDNRLLTSQAHIGAIGDVLGGVQLAHLASAQGIQVAEVLLTGKATAEIGFVPACLYSNPELATVGLREEEAQARGLDYTKACFPLKACGKAVVMGHSGGLVKLVYQKQTGLLLGVHILAPQASELISEGTLALTQGLTIQELSRIIHPHPTLSESLLEAAHLGLGLPINI